MRRNGPDPVNRLAGEPALDPQAGVEGVADGVADEVQAEDGDEEGAAGAKHDPGRLLEIAAAGVDHAAPGWLGRLHAEPEERERRLGQDGEGDAERGLDDD